MTSSLQKQEDYQVYILYILINQAVLTFLNFVIAKTCSKDLF